MIGVFGGTFDPIHYGHLRSALEVKEIFCLDEVRLIVSAQPPHKDTPVTVSEKRLQMLTLAVKNQADLISDRREIDRAGYSYMVDTLKSIRDEMAEVPILLFIGTDAFSGLTSWHQWKNLFDYAHIVVITRPGYQYQTLSEFLTNKITENKSLLQNKPSGCLCFQSVTPLDISATMIRNKVKKGLNPRFLLPDCVIDYIQQNKLYLK